MSAFYGVEILVCTLMFSLPTILCRISVNISIDSHSKGILVCTNVDQSIHLVNLNWAVKKLEADDCQDKQRGGEIMKGNRIQ